MIEKETRYLVCLGDTFLVATAVSGVGTPRKVLAVPRARTHDDYHMIGTTVGLFGEEMDTAVTALLAAGYIAGKRVGTAVSLTAQIAAWYLWHIRGIGRGVA